MKRFFSELKELSWVLGGTGLVLITLSGNTLKLGWWISIGSLIVYLVGTLLGRKRMSDFLVPIFVALIGGPIMVIAPFRSK